MSRLHQSIRYSGSSTSEQRLPALSFGQSSKPGLSFPLGTGLVVLIILLVSALFSLCYHWLRLRKLGSSILPGATAAQALAAQPPFAAAGPPTPDLICKAPSKLSMLQCPPVVYMAGDEMPRFIAVPCAFEGGSCKASDTEALEKNGLKPLDALKLDIQLL